MVTVCPPKGSNTALNYDLVKVDNVTLSNDETDNLRHAVFEVFIDKSHVEFASTALASADPQMIKEGSQSVPTTYGKTGFETLQWRASGKIRTPWYGEDFKKEYFLTDKYHHRVLDFPKDILNQIGNGSLVIELEIDTRVEDGLDEWVGYKEGSKYKYHKEKMTQYDAESRCLADGGHLASVLSDWESSDMSKFWSAQISLGQPWLGGMMSDEGVWKWKIPYFFSDRLPKRWKFYETF